MEKRLKIITSVIVSFIFILLVSTISYGVSSNISAGSTNIKVGQTTTITVGISNTETWNLKVTASGGTLSGETSSIDAAGGEVTKNVISCSFTASKAGTYTITLSGKVAGKDLIKQDVSKTITIAVTEETSAPPSGGGTGGNTGGTTTPTVTEPTFTSVNKTVYATGDINLRSSWSTSSSATKITKGTELKLTGTSTQTVNGYVWYRVEYNGQTKYVSKSLITETKPEENEEKSNNTNLKTLKIEGGELTPTFSSNVTEYSIKLVNHTENEIKVTAEAEDDKSTVKIEGNKNTALGENVIVITVTAEDGTTKIYTVTATKEEATALGLSSLIIKDVEFDTFNSTIFEYKIDFENLDKLEIEAVANQEGATVEIIGNENLVDGENIITIIVTSADGSETVTYQIKANKLNTVINEEKQLNITNILISGGIALVVLIIIIILIIKYVKRNNNSAIDYVYQDNLNKKDINIKEDDVEIAEEIAPSENVKENKSSVDDLFVNEEETQKRRGKGKHSR